VQGAVDAVRRWGAGATGSRLVTGSTEAHAALEQSLADHLGTDAALVLSTGYHANLSAITALAGRGDLVVSDAHNHASIVDACRLSRADVVVVPHRSPHAVEKVLASRSQRTAIVVTDAIFSVDGESADLALLSDICTRHDAVLVVDEAHALGVVGDGGRGSAHDAGIAGQPHVVLTATLSKALGSQGGVIAGHRAVVDHVVDTARAFIFDTGLAPAAVGAAHAALDVLRSDPSLPARARARAHDLARLATAAGWVASEPAAAVTSLRVGRPDLAVRAAAECAGLGVHVGCFRPPSVPDGVSRLRLTARADLTKDDMTHVAEVLAQVHATLDQPQARTDHVAVTGPGKPPVDQCELRGAGS
jgi:8-amino-7-oxononanoate synthase